MASEFPRSPRLLKGALVSYASQFLGPIPNVIVFQYNPAQLSRSLQSRAPNAAAGQRAGEAREETYRVEGPPRERITLSVELDAADQLAEPALHPHVVAFGLHPALAALELLLYPPTEQFLLRRALAVAGTVQHSPPEVPIVLFIWGRSRVVPVRLTTFTVTEEEFDPQLNPVRAKVDLGMDVLTYVDLRDNSVGYAAYLATQVQKEVLARLNLVNSAEQIIGMLPF